MKKEWVSEIALIRQWVYRRLNRSFNTVSPEDCEDAVQDALVAMIDHDLLSYLDVRERALAWLYTVARNKLIDRLRAKRELPMPHYNEPFSDDQHIRAFEDNNDLEAILAQLKPKERPIFELLRQGFSIREIAVMLERKKHTTHVQHARAITRLRSAYGRDKSESR